MSLKTTGRTKALFPGSLDQIVEQNNGVRISDLLIKNSNHTDFHFVIKNPKEGGSGSSQ